MDVVNWLSDLAHQPVVKPEISGASVTYGVRGSESIHFIDDEGLDKLFGNKEEKWTGFRPILVPVLDFDNVPLGHNLNATFVSTFRALAERFDGGCSAHVSRDWRFSDNSNPRQLWNEVYRKAVLGMLSRDHLLSPEGREVFIAAHREADEAFHTIGTEWCLFLNSLVEASNRIHNTKTVFVLILKNLSNAVDPIGALTAIRLLEHSHLAILVSGRKDLQQSLVRAFSGK